MSYPLKTTFIIHEFNHFKIVIHDFFIKNVIIFHFYYADGPIRTLKKVLFAYKSERGFLVYLLNSYIVSVLFH